MHPFLDSIDGRGYIVSSNENLEEFMERNCKDMGVVLVGLCYIQPTAEYILSVIDICRVSIQMCKTELYLNVDFEMSVPPSNLIEE